MELRDALRLMRSEIGLTQSELAEAVNVGFSAVSRWENHNTRPNRAASVAILALAKKRCVSAACLDALTGVLMASRAKDKADRALRDSVAERMKLERHELLTSAQLKAIVDNLDLAVIGQRIEREDPSKFISFYSNRRYTDIFGYPEAEFWFRSEGDPFFALSKEGVAEYQKKVRLLLGGKIKLDEFQMVLRAQKNGGAALWLEVRAVTLTDYSFGYELFISCRDVTARMEAERRDCGAAGTLPHKIRRAAEKGDRTE